MGPIKMLETIRRIIRCEQGATAVEYGLIVSLLVIAMIASFTSLAGTTNNMWNNVADMVFESSSF